MGLVEIVEKEGGSILKEDASTTSSAFGAQAKGIQSHTEGNLTMPSSAETSVVKDVSGADQGEDTPRREKKVRPLNA